MRINGVLPGPVLTRIVTEFLPDNDDVHQYYADLAPLKGWTMPEDIVSPVLFLASEEARKMTGHLLVVDGGLSAINQDAFAPPPEMIHQFQE